MLPRVMRVSAFCREEQLRSCVIVPFGGRAPFPLDLHRFFSCVQTMRMGDDYYRQAIEREDLAPALLVRAADDGDLVLPAGVTRTLPAAAFDAQVQRCLKQGLGQADAEARAAAVVPRPGCNEAGTGLAADILAEGYTRLDTGFADTDAYRWLCAYAADYGFILRWPEDSQAVTGMVFQPWHWRYVGVENARAIRASGQCLEAFLALRRADLS